MCRVLEYYCVRIVRSERQAALHHCCRNLLCEFDCLQRPFVEFDCCRLDHRKARHICVVVCSCRCKQSCIISLFIIQIRERHSMPVLRRQRICGQVSIFHSLFRVVVMAEDVERLPACIMMCRYAQDSVLHVVKCTRAFDCDIVAHCAVFCVIFISVICFNHEVGAAVSHCPVSDAFSSVKRCDVVKVIDYVRVVSIRSHLCCHSNCVPDSCQL